MEKKRKHITPKTVDFVTWYHGLEPDMREFANALLIANIEDEELDLIRKKTIHNYPLFTGVIHQVN